MAVVIVLVVLVLIVLVLKAKYAKASNEIPSVLAFQGSDERANLQYCTHLVSA